MMEYRTGRSCLQCRTTLSTFAKANVLGRSGSYVVQEPFLPPDANWLEGTWRAKKKHLYDRRAFPPASSFASAKLVRGNVVGASCWFALRFALASFCRKAKTGADGATLSRIFNLVVRPRLVCLSASWLGGNYCRRDVLSPAAFFMRMRQAVYGNCSVKIMGIVQSAPVCDAGEIFGTFAQGKRVRAVWQLCRSRALFTARCKQTRDSRGGGGVWALLL